MQRRSGNVRNKYLFLFLFLASWTLAHSSPLATSELPPGEVWVVHADFDPITKVHEDYFRSILAKNPNATLLLLPKTNEESPHSLPYQMREEMIESLYSDNPRVLYPSPKLYKTEFKDFVKANPESVLKVATGGELLDPASLKIRKELAQFYLEDSQPLLTHPVIEALPGRITKDLYRSKAYLGYSPIDPDQVRSVLKLKISNKVIKPLGMYEFVRQAYIKKDYRGALLEYTLPSGENLKVIRPLGNGRAVNSYLVARADGQQVVLKVLHEGRVDPSLLQARTSEIFLSKQSKIPVAKVFETDPSGLWSLNEFVDGTTMNRASQELLSSQKDLLAQIESIYNESKRTFETSGFTVDLTADNFILENKTGRLILVDPAPRPRSWGPQKDFKTFLAHEWGFTPKLTRTPLNCFFGVLSSIFIH